MLENVEQQLVTLFTHYIEGFHSYNMQTVLNCYHLPCTLHTPEKIAYLQNEQAFEQEFIDIFTVLKHANITKIVASKASYNKCHAQTVDVCIDWLFYDNSGELFTDFTAYYHVVLQDEGAREQSKIVSVVSHQIENSVELPYTFQLN